MALVLMCACGHRLGSIVEGSRCPQCGRTISLGGQAQRPPSRPSPASDSAQTVAPGPTIATDAHEPALMTMRGDTPPAPAPGPAAPGEGYRAERELGRGGMGVVMLAEQLVFSREVALKTVLRPDRDANARFRAEAVVTAWLEHPNIVPVHDLVTLPDGSPRLVMKRVDGHSWRELLHPRPPLPEGDSRHRSLGDHLEILLNVCDAVAFAHSRKVIHRDLKSENVMVGAFGEVLVMDWGCAVAINGFDGPAGIPLLARVSGVAGTPAYMAPEMARGDRSRIGPASDVYLLGAILYEILTGTPPHRGGGLAGTLACASEGIIEAPAQRAPEREIPPELAALALRALEREPARRPASVGAFREGITTWKSHRLAEQAVAIARQQVAAARATPYGREDHLRQAQAACEQAIASWPEMREAVELRIEVLLQLAEECLASHAWRRAQELAHQAERDGGPARAKVKERAKRCLAAAATGQRAEESRRRQMLVLRVATVAISLVLVLGLTIGIIIVSSERRTAEHERERAAQAGEVAQAERDKAVTAYVRQRSGEFGHWRESAWAALKENQSALSLARYIKALEVFHCSERPEPFSAEDASQAAELWNATLPWLWYRSPMKQVECDGQQGWMADEIFTVDGKRILLYGMPNQGVPENCIWSLGDGRIEKRAVTADMRLREGAHLTYGPGSHSVVWTRGTVTSTDGTTYTLSLRNDALVGAIDQAVKGPVTLRLTIPPLADTFRARGGIAKGSVDVSSAWSDGESLWLTVPVFPVIAGGAPVAWFAVRVDWTLKAPTVYVRITDASAVAASGSTSMAALVGAGTDAIPLRGLPGDAAAYRVRGGATADQVHLVEPIPGQDPRLRAFSAGGSELVGAGEDGVPERFAIGPNEVRLTARWPGKRTEEAGGAGIGGWTSLASASVGGDLLACTLFTYDNKFAFAPVTIELLDPASLTLKYVARVQAKRLSVVDNRFALGRTGDVAWLSMGIDRRVLTWVDGDAIRHGQYLNLPKTAPDLRTDPDAVATYERLLQWVGYRSITAGPHIGDLEPTVVMQSLPSLADDVPGRWQVSHAQGPDEVWILGADHTARRDDTSDVTGWVLDDTPQRDHPFITVMWAWDLSRNETIDVISGNAFTGRGRGGVIHGRKISPPANP